MRKMMTKEVTFTKVNVSKIEVVSGKPELVELGTETFFGNKSDKQIEKEVTKMYGTGVTAYGKEVETKVYEMEVEEFIKLASEKTDNDETEKDSE